MTAGAEPTSQLLNSSQKSSHKNPQTKRSYLNQTMAIGKLNSTPFTL